MASEMEIRHEESTNVKVAIVSKTTNFVDIFNNIIPQIFPLSLNTLLSLSDRVQKFSTDVNGIRPCHGCDKQAASLMKCARCSLFWYCDGVSLLSKPVGSKKSVWWESNGVEAEEDSQQRAEWVGHCRGFHPWNLVRLTPKKHFDIFVHRIRPIQISYCSVYIQVSFKRSLGVHGFDEIASSATTNQTSHPPTPASPLHLNCLLSLLDSEESHISERGYISIDKNHISKPRKTKAITSAHDRS
jgi:hypothetical protein